jgi:hypothetical protein
MFTLEYLGNIWGGTVLRLGLERVLKAKHFYGCTEHK